jgi:hypothetical protein
MASAGPVWLGIARCGHGGYPPSIIPSTPETSIAFAPTDRPNTPSPRIAQDRPQHLNDRLTRQQGSAAISIETKLTQTGSGTKLRCYMRDSVAI